MANKSNTGFDSSDNVRTARPLRYAWTATFTGPVKLELGGELPSVSVAYETYGKLGPARDQSVANPSSRISLAQ